MSSLRDDQMVLPFFPLIIIIIIVIIIMVSPFLRFPFEVACDYPRALKTTFNFFSLCFSAIADGASLTQVAFLLSEGSIFAGVSHPNIHSPVAVSLTVPPAPKIAYPFAAGGNLKM